MAVSPIALGARPTQALSVVPLLSEKPGESLTIVSPSPDDWVVMATIRARRVDREVVVRDRSYPT
jgi:hypothetical protein